MSSSSRTTSEAGGSDLPAGVLAQGGAAGPPAHKADNESRDGRRPAGYALNAIRGGPVLILLVLVVGMWIAEPLFITERNIQNLVLQTAPIALLAMGQLLVIVTRGIDLSVGSAMALTTVTGVLVFHEDWGSPTVTIAAFLLTGLMCGLANGFIFVKGKIPTPFVVTLATLGVYRGLALVLSDGESVSGVPNVVLSLGGDFVGPVPVPALVVAVVALVVFILTTRMVWGRWIYAVGGNPEAASRLGIPVDRVLISVYALSGLAAGVAGILIAGRTASGFPTAGNLAELDSISAVIIGGASLFGGRGGVAAALIGALTIGVIRNGLNLLGVSPFYQLVAIGCIIIVAVELDVLRSRVEDRLRSAEARAELAKS